ncbi:MAG: family 1 glycosylhydrolase [Deltaproteobacteria bacterium]|nr:family 1 glycosylhydrolase [Deltaproteobacteria bacterium]
MSVQFPAGFVWGTATAAHQVEGNNVNSDFWLLEHTPGTLFAEPSGDACDHFHRYGDDIRLLKALGFGAYRFSVEWARIEPEEGCFSLAALDHYRRMLAACHEHGVRPCVTFHHFTSPRWFTADGGWERSANADRFARYCERTVAHLGDLIDTAYTINEANLLATLAVSGVLPPDGWGARAPFVAEAAKRCGVTQAQFGPFFLGHPMKITDTMLAAHIKSRDVLKAGPGSFPVGITLAMQDYQAVAGGEAKRDEARRVSFDPFLEAARADDLIGVQTYSRVRFGADGPLPPQEGVPVLIMGYEFWPEALEQTIRYAASVARVPVYVTENGIGTTDDSERFTYVRRALEGVGRCLADGIDVRGYFYWSLMDNFEWLFGYGPQFGLVAVDRATQRRRPKPSAEWLGAVARANALD